MRRTSLFLGAFVGATLVTGVAWAAIPNSPAGTITGCYAKTGGALRIIDRQAGKKCKSTEKELSWAQVGPAGPAGPSGGSSSSFHVKDANGTELGLLVSAPPEEDAPNPGDPAEFSPNRAAVVLRTDGTYAAYDVSSGSVPRHGALYYFSNNCSGTAYVRLDELTTFFSFYGIPPLEVDSSGNPVRGLTVSGAVVVPADDHALSSTKNLGEAGCLDLSAVPLSGVAFSVKAAATATYTPADVTGPLHISRS
jgi:hypothetical protein